MGGVRARPCTSTGLTRKRGQNPLLTHPGRGVSLCAEISMAIPRTKPPQTTPQCEHHFILPAAEEYPSVIGVCKHCGEARECTQRPNVYKHP